MISYDEFMSDIIDVPITHRRFLLEVFGDYGNSFGGTDGASYFSARKKVVSQTSEILMYQNLMVHLARKGVKINFFFLKNNDNDNDKIEIFFETIDKIRSGNFSGSVRRDGFWIGKNSEFHLGHIDDIVDFFAKDEFNILYVKSEEYMKNWEKIVGKLVSKYRGRYLVFFE